ncbi:S8 family serine peptidase [Nitrosococcus watsonii]|uniref:Peptidase S8 and S53 subtilisin kexin sedolisin n=1 Tax=Nitrosococcus watsoni (strain C-113) TaxID=105559 RepID=D8K4X5_NITWC|nr:S8 family serine peptidase [Nitrosococcus watsonii]ADJ27952.1 peptidase S8 and S53 subtilisin kexin sedolisin [Nitrosococcus watsonii C-113]
MFKIRIYLGACIFFSLILSTTIATEQSLEKKGPSASKNEALSRLMEKLLREKSPLPLNLNINHDTSTGNEATVKSTEHTDSRADTPSSQAPQLPPAIAVGVIVRFKSPEIQALARDNLPPPPEMVAELEAALGEKLIFERATVNEAYVFSFLAPKEGKEAIDAFLQPARELPSIDWIEANQRVQMQSSSVRAQPSIAQAQSFSNDPNFGDQWNMMSESEGVIGGIDAVHAWDITHGSPDTIVAVVDTGVLSHPEFADRLLPGYDFVSNPFHANDGDGRDSDASDPGDWVNKGECSRNHDEPSSWHGTHVAGIIAASGDDGYGIAGVNWKTRILPVRVLGTCNGTDGDIIEGMMWAAGLPVPGVPDNPNPAQVINLSVGGPGLSCPFSYSQAIDKIVSRGVSIIVAAGNKGFREDNSNALYSVPANCFDVFVVVATNPSGEPAGYTYKQPFYNISTAISAPGGDMGEWIEGIGYTHKEDGILSTIGLGAKEPQGYDYQWYHGTSMAAPHVSGIASLVLAVNPNLSGIELYPLLRFASRPFSEGGSCDDYGTSMCGSGIADAYRSVEFAEVLKNYRLVYEFSNVISDHYMLTASKEDVALLYQGGEGLEGWYNTRKYSYAWSGPEEGAVPVCRFYTLGANSHFYTANAEDCAYLKTLNPDNIYADDKWTYEDIAFYAKLPTNGICPADSAPIYRVYNNRWMYNDSNHRFVSSDSMRRVMLDKGWVDEGVAFCAAFVQDSLTFLD